MTHPVVLAARAAIKELTTDESKDFFKSTAMEHSMLAMFYFLEAVYWTVEAGRLTRRFVDSFSTPEPETEVIIAGLLCPAKDKPPITTEAIVTNEQKLEQHITNTIKGIYDHEFCTEIDSVGGPAVQQNGEQAVEPDQGHLLLSVEGSSPPESKSESPVSTRTRKPRAASGDTGKTKDPVTAGRVPRKKRGVPQE